MQINETFTVLKPDMLMDALAATPDLYSRLDSDYDNFKSHALISSYTFQENWTSWEKHPHGDELVLLLAGSVKFILQHEGDDETIALTEIGQYVIVPRNPWHTAQVEKPSRLLFITPGEGTRHRAIGE